ncbi:MAG: hypothetical protein VR70_11000 [Rhodospirillaceae bacterium BRH_c57]|nr:MAG: hypothetical protein VR70_11000 [Rhodospirillaceae bacterium BRH_c57]
MLAELRLRLEAVDDTRNIRRGYSIHAGRDLFGQWCVEARWGRLGSPNGTVMRLHAGDEVEARKAVRAALRKRQTSPRRIGVPYEVKEAIYPEGSEASDWG